MANYRKCIDELSAAAGRQLTDDEIDAIYSRIHKAALDIKAGRVQTQDVRLGDLGGAAQDIRAGSRADEARVLIQRAADLAAAGLEAEANLKEFRANLQLVRLQQAVKTYEGLVASGVDRLKAVEYMLHRDYTGKIKIESVEQRVFGYRAALGRQLIEAWESLGNDFLGFFQDPAKELLLVRELHGENTGDAMARKGAEKFAKVADQALEVFNENGGNIGKLDDWAHPQHHAPQRVATAAGADQPPDVNRQAWVDFVYPMVDEARYVDDVTGQQLTPDEIREFLGAVWETIATDGWSKITPGKGRGTGGRATRHAEHRQIHFKGAEEALAYWKRFGDKTVFEILNSHVEVMAKDIAFVEMMGPNPRQTFETIRDMAMQQSAVADPAHTEKYRAAMVGLDNLWEYANGTTKPVYREWLKATADGLANLNVAAKLGGAALASFFGDKPMMEAVAVANNEPTIARWRAELALLNPVNKADRRLLRTQGLMLDGIRSGLQRFYEGLGQSSTTGKLANAVMRLTGMQAINDIRKGSFSLMLMSAIGKEIGTGRQWADLHSSDVRTLRQYGITEADWGIWKLAQLQTIKDVDSVLTPDAIARVTDHQIIAAGLAPATATPRQLEKVRRNGIVKLLGAVNTEAEFAIVTPGWQERVQFYGGEQRGTVKGELARSVLQFKSFPWAFFQRGMDAVANQQGPAAKSQMIAYLILSTTMAGAMLMQTREMLSGRDPKSMVDENWYKFWGQAFLYGGALGIYGDFLYGANQTRYGSGPIEAIAGPTVGPLLEMTTVLPMAAIKAGIEGKESHFGARMLQNIKGFVPGSNIWYTKSAMDHLVWQRAAEALSPGYLSAMRRRTQRETGQDWWWQPGEGTPERAPNLGAAVE